MINSCRRLGTQNRLFCRVTACHYSDASAFHYTYRQDVSVLVSDQTLNGTVRQCRKNTCAYIILVNEMNENEGS